jgi:hypothetical protein
MKSTRNAPSQKRKINLKSHTFQLSAAKTYLGRLTEKARKGEPVYIIRGQDRFILQHVPPPEPIPVRPPGYFAHCYTKKEINQDNRLSKHSVITAPKDLE